MKSSIKNIVAVVSIGVTSLFCLNTSYAINNGKVKVETANLRETANENAKILEQLSINDKVEVIEKEGEWYKVSAEGITGYLREDLITVSEEKNNTITNNNEIAQNQTNDNNVTTTQNQISEATNETEEPKEAVNEEKVEPKQEENKEEANPQEQKENTLTGKQKVLEDTKLKIVPVINATNISEVKKEEIVDVVEVMNGWISIETKTTKGWIRKEKLQKQEEQVKPVEEVKTPEVGEQTKNQTVSKTLYVNASRVNVRKEANSEAEIITKLQLNKEVEVIEENNGWSKVKVDGKEGYISSSLLSSTKKQEETSRSKTTTRKATTNTEVKNEQTKTANNSSKESTKTPSTPATGTTTVPASGKGASVVAYAKQFIGTKYTYGGTSPATGFDCSGFTSYVYKNFGINLPRTSGGQSRAGVAVDRNNLATGDLVIYSGHVAIYVGGGQVIHAPRPGKTVSIVPLGQAAKTYLGARRVL